MLMLADRRRLSIIQRHDGWVKGADNYLVGNCSLMFSSGWPRHRENREFGSYFFQTGKTQGILL